MLTYFFKSLNLSSSEGCSTGFNFGLVSAGLISCFDSLIGFCSVIGAGPSTGISVGLISAGLISGLFGGNNLPLNTNPIIATKTTIIAIK